MKKNTYFIGTVWLFLLSCCSKVNATSENKYKITWLDQDNTILKTTFVNEGEIPDYGETIHHYEDATGLYYFKDWNSELIPAYNDATYKATYIENTDLFYCDERIKKGMTLFGFKTTESINYIDDGVVRLPSKYQGSDIVTIGTFNGNQTIKEVIFPSTIKQCITETSIFFNFRNLRNIVIDEGNPYFAFSNHTLTTNDGKTLVTCLNTASGTYHLNQNITKIYSQSFDNCENIDYFDTGSNSSFSSFEGILIDNNRQSIITCPRAKSGQISLPRTIVESDNAAFMFCTNIVSVTFSEGFKKMNASTFYGCAQLASVHLPTSLTSIDVSEFGQCVSLTRLQYAGTMTQWNNIQKIQIDGLELAWNSESSIKEIVCSDGIISL